MLNQVGDRLHGFTVTRIRESEELGGRVVELVYDQTGTPLCWVDNGLQNKLFSITFKTLPEQSNGVFHILEHSVLCGSKKYPVREPFVELLKSSMNTFLNAMTFPDKTMYPVSSRNTRDFLNLTEVYLDAVFAPAILKNPNIFYQEGWHIEQDEDGTLSYKGVVFNEMKGALSHPDSYAEYKMLEMLFPDTPYCYNSGGDPAVIPTLTYEKFVETYHRFYHPSNAFIFLDGDVPLEETLTLLEEYLSQYDRKEELPVIPMQTPVSSEATIEYEISKEEPLEDHAHLYVGKIIGTWDDRVKYTAVSVIMDVLMSGNESPLTRPLLSEQLTNGVTYLVDDSVPQGYLMLTFKNITDGKSGEILSLIRKTVTEMLENGLPRKLFEASLNSMEFRSLEHVEPLALDHCIDSMNSWLHGGDPMLYLTERELFKEVRKMLDDGRMEALIREIFLEGTEFSVLLANPSHTRGEALRAAETARLEETVSKWTDAQKEENRRLNEKLLLWQQTPDTPEQLATLPKLPVSELSEEPPWVDTDVETLQGTTILKHTLPTRGIVYLTLYCPMTDCTLEEISMMSLIISHFCKLPTAHYSALELQQELKLKLGGVLITCDTSAKRDQTETCAPLLQIYCKCFPHQIEDAARLLKEVLLTTDFTQKEKVREFIMQTDHSLKEMGISAGHNLGRMYTLARYSAMGAVTDALSGYAKIQTVHKFAKNFDEEYEKYLALANRLVKKNLCRANMIVGVTCSEEADISPVLNAFPEGTALPWEQAYSVTLPQKAGYQIPAQIGFAVQGYRLGDGKSFTYHGSMRIAVKLISLSYLWNVVRVQCGAYGTAIQIVSTGELWTLSFRDPTPIKAIEANKGISDFIRSFCESDETVDKYIISAVSDMLPLTTPQQEGAMASAFWLAGHTYDRHKRLLSEMLHTTKEDLLRGCADWDAFAENGAICICAAENQLKEFEDLEILPN